MAEEEGALRTLPVDMIQRGKYQPRRDMDQESLQELADSITAKSGSVVDIDVIGHTDSTGPEEYNEQLSLRRATSVKNYMVEQGVDAGIIDVSGKGETMPIADNSTRAGRAQNRRVEINVGADVQQ